MNVVCVGFLRGAKIFFGSSEPKLRGDGFVLDQRSLLNRIIFRVERVEIESRCVIRRQNDCIRGSDDAFSAVDEKPYWLLEERRCIVDLPSRTKAASCCDRF